VTFPIPVPFGSKPYVKAIEVLGKVLSIPPNAVAKVYQDWVSPIAEARRIKLIGKANAEVLEINAEANLKIRAKERDEAKVIERQVNLEEIVHLAAENISNDTNEVPVEEEWISRFTSIAQDVSKQELKSIWSKILAGEIKKPGSFSLRTLEILKNITADEATTFMRFCSLSDVDGCLFSGGESISHVHFGIQYYHILMLQEAGLVLSGGQGGYLSLQVKLVPNEHYGVHFGEYDINISAKEQLDLFFHYYKLTRAGIELSTLIEEPKNFEFIQKLAKWFPLDSRLQAELVKIA
jgi:hypothetical protein